MPALTVYLRDDQVTRLRAESARTDAPVSALVRRAIEMLLVSRAVPAEATPSPEPTP